MKRPRKTRLVRELRGDAQLELGGERHLSLSVDAALDVVIEEAATPPTVHRDPPCRERTGEVTPTHGECFRCGAANGERCRNPPRPIHPGSCVWLGGEREDGSCDACGQPAGVGGCSWPDRSQPRPTTWGKR